PAAPVLRGRSTPVPYPTLFRSHRPLKVIPLAGWDEDLAFGGVCGVQLDQPNAVHRIEDAEFLERVGAFDLSRDTLKELRILYAIDRKSTRLNSSHVNISYAVFC